MVIQMKHTMVIDGDDFLHFLKYIFFNNKKEKDSNNKRKETRFL